MLGCGNSRLSEDVSHFFEPAIISLKIYSLTLIQMWKDGYHNIVNIDVRISIYRWFSSKKVNHNFSIPTFSLHK